MRCWKMSAAVSKADAFGLAASRIDSSASRKVFAGPAPGGGLTAAASSGRPNSHNQPSQTPFIPGRISILKFCHFVAMRAAVARSESILPPASILQNWKTITLFASLVRNSQLSERRRSSSKDLRPPAHKTQSKPSSEAKAAGSDMLRPNRGLLSGEIFFNRFNKILSISAMGMPVQKRFDLTRLFSKCCVAGDKAILMSVRAQCASFALPSKMTISGASGHSPATPHLSVYLCFCAMRTAAHNPTGPAPTMAMRRRAEADAT
mmetsp:Transcript_136775/g.354732  ORF Transcript_136775/g.354732 Transcript_136775/m.354732 type:complete len:263 (+) Transcript_136775:285-1073(+)